MKKNTRILNVFLILLLVITSSFTKSLNADQCVVHLDKSFYVTGEVIWFKIYLPSESKGNPFTMRVGLLDQQGQVADYFFLQTEGKTYASGYYKIPFDRASGIHHLVFMGQEQTSKRPVVLAKVAVPIYNDLEKLNISAITPVAKASDKSLEINDLQIEISLNKSSYQSREAVQANVIVKDKNGRPVKANLSIAVSDWALTGSEVMSQATVQQGYPIGTTAFDDHIYARTKLAAEKLNENLIGIYAAQDWQMFYASPDKEGTFFIAMPHFYGNKTIQFLGYPNPAIDIQLEEPVKSAPAAPLVYTEGILKYLQLSQQRKKIFQLYKTLETNLNNEKADEEIEPIQPDRSIRTQEYESFEDIATFIREISSPVAFTLDRKKNLYSARIYNPAAQTFYPNDPMFIIDGKVTRNADFAARLKLNQIEQIDLYYNFDKLFENFLVIGSSGVISITTKSGVLIPEEEEKDIFKINGLQYPAAFPEFRPEQVNNNAHQPFFRPQLFWNPSVETNEQGQATLQFFQSDDISTFRIEVVAQSEDGTIGIGRKEYVVSWK